MRGHIQNQNFFSAEKRTATIFENESHTHKPELLIIQLAPSKVRMFPLRSHLGRARCRGCLRNSHRNWRTKTQRETIIRSKTCTLFTKHQRKYSCTLDSMLEVDNEMACAKQSIAFLWLARGSNSTNTSYFYWNALMFNRLWVLARLVLHSTFCVVVPILSTL